MVKIMMGGAWFEQYIGTKSNQDIYTMALDELKKHLNIQVDPDVYEVSVLKVRITCLSAKLNRI